MSRWMKLVKTFYKNIITIFHFTLSGGGISKTGTIDCVTEMHEMVTELSIKEKQKSAIQIAKEVMAHTKLYPSLISMKTEQMENLVRNTRTKAHGNFEAILHSPEMAMIHDDVNFLQLL